MGEEGVDGGLVKGLGGSEVGWRRFEVVWLWRGLDMIPSLMASPGHVKVSLGDMRLQRSAVQQCSL